MTADAAPCLASTQREARWIALKTGITDPFMIPYILALGATPVETGLLASSRNVLLAATQLAAGPAVGWFGGRRSLILYTAGTQALLWLPIAFAGPLFGGAAIPAVILLYTAATAVSALGGPAWGSLVAEYLRDDQRGRFFGVRARVMGLWSSVAGLAAGGVLQLTSARPLLGFGTLALAASLARAASWRELRRLHEEPWHAPPESHWGFLQFLRQARRNNLVRFACCIAGLNLAAQVAAPFFAVYMLEVLRFSYIEYTAVVVAGAITGFLASAWWGGLGDRVGNHAVLRWTTLGVVPLPALWPLLPNVLWLGVLNILGAFLWAGLNLCAVNFLYDAVSPRRRHHGLAYFNLLNGGGIAIGAALGGLLAEWRPFVESGAPYTLLFVLSAVARSVSALAFVRLVREVRKVRVVGLREVVVDELSQGLEQVLGFFSVRPEREHPEPPAHPPHPPHPPRRST